MARSILAPSEATVCVLQASDDAEHSPEEAVLEFIDIAADLKWHLTPFCMVMEQALNLIRQQRMVDPKFKEFVDGLQADVNHKFGSSMEGVWMLPLQCM